MSNSSREKIAFAHRPAGVRLVVDELPGAVGKKPHSCLKDLQRKAFERGAAVERQAWTKKIEALMKEVEALKTGARTRRSTEKTEIEEFAVRLAMHVVEKIVPDAVEAGRHDIKKMVEDVLAEVHAREDNGGPEIRLHPDDHAHLLAALAESPGGRVLASSTLIADGTCPRGSFVVRTEDTTLYSILAERLETMRSKLLDAVRNADA